LPRRHSEIFQPYSNPTSNLGFVCSQLPRRFTRYSGKSYTLLKTIILTPTQGQIGGSVELTATTLCDIAISVSLWYYLHKGRFVLYIFP
jgi:hypothetical protein